MSKKITDAKIIEKLLETLRYSANAFALELEYKSASSIYHIINGENSISTDMMNRVSSKFPQVNQMFMLKGEEPILIDNAKSIGQMNLMGPNHATFDGVPSTLKNIESLLEQILEKMNDGK